MIKKQDVKFFTIRKNGTTKRKNVTTKEHVITGQPKRYLIALVVLAIDSLSSI